MNVVTFGVWLDPGDSGLSVHLDVYTQSDNGGSFVFGTDMSVAEVYCKTNSTVLPFVLKELTFSALAGPTLSAGTYWMWLYNGTTRDGTTTVAWDINQGVGCTSPGCPSNAVDEAGGPISSAAFTIYSKVEIQPTPEPGSLMLLGTGAVGLASLGWCGGRECASYECGCPSFREAKGWGRRCWSCPHLSRLEQSLHSLP